MDAVQELADLPYAEHLQPHDGPITSEGNYDTVHFTDTEFCDAQGHGARFIESAFTSVTFTGGRLRRARFNEVWMHGVRIVAIDLAETEWLDCAVESGMLAGVEAFDAQLWRVRFTRCKLNGVNFRGGKLHDVEFVDCTLQNVDFGDAQLTGVRFPGSALHEVRLNNATLKKVDLRGATELGLASGHEGLAGAIISSAQLIQLAPVLAKAMKITVKAR